VITIYIIEAKPERYFVLTGWKTYKFVNDIEEATTFKTEEEAKEYIYSLRLKYDWGQQVKVIPYS
jgi:hypothetical protein